MSTPAGGLIGDAHINVNANTTSAQLALTQLSRHADGRLRDIRGRFTSESRLINTAFTRAAGGGSAFADTLDKLKSSAISLVPALIPIAAQAAPIAVGVGAAAAAVGAFAAAAAGQVSAITEAAEAEEKYQDAVDEHGATSKQAAEAQNAYVRQVEKMPPATRTAAAALSSLKDQYQDWSDSLAASTMPVATKAFQTFGAVFPKLTPLVQGAGVQLDRFVTIAAGGVQSPGFDRFMRSFTEFATGSLAKANDMLIRFTRTLDTGQVSGGVAQFMEYVRANGPLVRDTLAKVAEALSNVLQAVANVGPGLLTVVNALAGIVAAVPPDVITTLLQLALAMKAVRLAAAAMAATSAAVAGFTASIGAMRLAAAGATGVLPRLGAAMGAMSRSAKLAVAGTGIGLLLIAMAKLSDLGKTTPPDVDKLTVSLKRLADTGKFTGELKATFGSVDGLVDKIKLLNQETAKSKETALGFRIPVLDDIADSVADSINEMSKGRKSLSALKDDFTGLDEAMAALVSSGNGKMAAQDFNAIKQAALAQGHSLKEINALFPKYRASVADAKFEQQLAAAAMGLFGQQAQATSAKLAEQKQSADGLRQAIQALNDVNRQGLGGMIGFEAAIDAASKAAKENAGVLSFQGGQLSLNTEKQRTAAQALTDLAAKTDEAAGAARESGQSWSSVNGIYERGRQQLIANATQMGLTRAEAEKLAATILKTPNKTALLKADITDWKSKISEAEKQLKTAKGDKRAKLTAKIDDWTTKVSTAEKQLRTMKDEKTAKIKGNLADLKEKLRDAKGRLSKVPDSRKAKVRAEISDLTAKIGRAKAALNGLQDKQVNVRVSTTYYQKGLPPGPYAPGYARGGLVSFARGGPVTTGLRLPGFPHGGPVRGPGTGTSDSVLARVSNGEFVMRNAAVQRYGVNFFEMLNSMQLNVGRTASRSQSAPARGAAPAPVTIINVTLANHGVIGSQIEVDNWLARSLENLGRTGRLPAAVGGR